MIQEIKMSTYPKDETVGMVSWFPIFFPLKIPLKVSADAILAVHVWRFSSPRKDGFREPASIEKD